MRSATIDRTTHETKISISLNLDGGSLETNGSADGDAQAGHATQSTGGQCITVNTGIGFLDHMLHALAKHSGWSLKLDCKGDLYSRTLGKEQAG